MAHGQIVSLFQGRSVTAHSCPGEPALHANSRLPPGPCLWELQPPRPRKASSLPVYAGRTWGCLAHTQQGKYLSTGGIKGISWIFSFLGKKQLLLLILPYKLTGHTSEHISEKREN